MCVLAHVSCVFLQMIAGATAALVRAVYPTVSKHKTATALMLTPIQPLMVTSANTAGVEVHSPSFRILLPFLPLLKPVLLMAPSTAHELGVVRSKLHSWHDATSQGAQ